MTNLTILAAEEPSGLDLVLPAGEELLWGALSFLVVASFLMKYAFPRIQQSVQAREASVRGALEEAETSKSEAHRLLEEYRQQLADARGQANRIVEESRQQAEQVRRDMIARAETEARQVVERAQEQIQAERSRTIQELQSTIAGLSIDLAEKVVGRSIDADSQRDLVDAYINEVSSMSSGDNGAVRP